MWRECNTYIWPKQYVTKVSVWTMPNKQKPRLAIFAVDMLHHLYGNSVDAVRSKVSFQCQSRGCFTVKSWQLFQLSEVPPGSVCDKTLSVGRKISVTLWLCHPCSGWKLFWWVTSVIFIEIWKTCLHVLVFFFFLGIGCEGGKNN